MIVKITNERGFIMKFMYFINDKIKCHIMKGKKYCNPNEIQPEYVCTGHSGIRKYSDSIFAHINESAQFSSKKPFDDKAPYDVFN